MATRVDVGAAERGRHHHRRPREAAEDQRTDQEIKQAQLGVGAERGQRTKHIQPHHTALARAGQGGLILKDTGMVLKFDQNGDPVSLADLDSGSLFLFENTLCLKSDYITGQGAVEAFIVGSGEMFWGGTTNQMNQPNLFVQPVQVINGSDPIDFDTDAADSAGIRSAIDSVLAERARQNAKWGEQNHFPQYWMGILGEEFGELCQAVNETVFNNGPAERAKGGYANMRAEAVQVAAVAVAFVEMLDRRHKEGEQE